MHLLVQCVSGALTLNQLLFLDSMLIRETNVIYRRPMTLDALLQLLIRKKMFF